MVLPVETEALDAQLLQEEEADSKAETGKERPELVMYTDGSWLDNGTTEPLDT